MPTPGSIPTAPYRNVDSVWSRIDFVPIDPAFDDPPPGPTHFEKLLAKYRERLRKTFPQEELKETVVSKDTYHFHAAAYWLVNAVPIFAYGDVRITRRDIFGTLGFFAIGVFTGPDRNKNRIHCGLVFNNSEP